MLQVYQTSKTAFGKGKIKKFLSDNYPLLSVLVGFLLVALSIGPYQNGDSKWELDAVSGIMNYGLPYTNGYYLMDQPPLGFYIQAAFFRVFSLSINNGTFLVTLFGLGCIALMYGIGRALYNRATGFFAAMLFAFSPWHLVLSRSFLIDVQCLFFSLLSLFVGIVAISKDSLKFFIAAGLSFAAAFITKLYAVFTLTPLLILFFYSGTKKPKRLIGSVTAFVLPLLLFYYLWYQTISGLGITSIFGHTDFMVHNVSGIVPSSFFVGNFLINYGLGWFFLDAVVLSVLVYFFGRRLFGKFMVFEACCLAVIVIALGIDTYLGAILNLKAPYLNAIKYDYHSLPFFSFLAASLVTKSVSLSNIAKIKTGLSKKALFLLSWAGVFLVVASILYNMRYIHLFSTANFLIFKVEPAVNVGYSLFNSAPISGSSPLMVVQYAGFTIALSGLVWISRHKLRLLIQREKTVKGTDENKKVV